MPNKISFTTKYPTNITLDQILQDVPEVAALLGEECYNYVGGVVDVIKWQLEQGLIEPRDARASLAHIWGQQGLGEAVK